MGGLASTTAFVSRNAEMDKPTKVEGCGTPVNKTQAFQASLNSSQIEATIRRPEKTVPVSEEKKTTFAPPPVKHGACIMKQGAKLSNPAAIRKTVEYVPDPEETWNIYEPDEIEDCEPDGWPKSRRNFTRQYDDGDTY